MFPINVCDHLSVTDNEVTAALLKAAFDEDKPGHMHARRIVQRDHFKLLYGRNPKDVEINPEAGAAVFKAIVGKFGENHFRHDRYKQMSGAPDFPVRMPDRRIVSSLSISETLNNVPVISVDYVFADQSVRDEVNEWLRENLEDIIKLSEEEDDDG